MAASLDQNPNTVAALSVKQEEDEKEKDCRKTDKELVSTLRTSKSWKIQSLMYQYQGFWYYSGTAVEGVMWMQKKFKSREDDVLLVSFPRCGTTWFKSLMFSIMNRTRYDFTSQSQSHPLLTSSPHELVPFLEFYLGQNLPFPDRDNLSPPNLFHTHVAFPSLPKAVTDSRCRIVYICRNPKDVFVSTFLFLSRWNISVPLEEALDLFCNGVSVYGPFWDHVLGFWKASSESPDRILFMKYEDVKSDTVNNVRKLAEFMGHPFSPEEERQGLVHEIMELCSFDNLRNLDANKSGAITVGGVSTGKETFFRKGEVGDWKNHLTPEMANRIDGIIEEKLSGSGLTFSDTAVC